MKLKTLDDIEIKDKAVLLRIDINSPVKEGKLIDNPRLEASAKTIKELLKKKAKLIIIAHQGRPDSSDFIPLKEHAKFLSKYANSQIKYVDDLFNTKAKKEIKSLKPGSAIILKNVREYPDELNPKSKGNRYKKFCSYFDIYVNDAFSVSHRSQSSVIIPPRYLKSAIGRQFEKEIEFLKDLLYSSSKERVFLLGGVKIEDYFPFFKLLKNRKNKILASGILANLLLIAQGHNLGYEATWLQHNNYLKILPKLKRLYKKYHEQIILPIDFGLITNTEERKDVSLNEAPYPYKIFDVGPMTVKLFKKFLVSTNYILMKGPLGFSEIPEFDKSTSEILKFISNLKKNKKLITVIGGGHLVTTAKKYKILHKFSHYSLSGGALISYLTGIKLPGIEALEHSSY